MIVFHSLPLPTHPHEASGPGVAAVGRLELQADQPEEGGVPHTFAGNMGAQKLSVEGLELCSEAETVEATAMLFPEATGRWPSGLGASVGPFLEDGQSPQCTSRRGHHPGP